MPVRIFYLRGLFRKCGYTEEFIKTISGQGYIFTREVREIFQDQSERLDPTAPVEPENNLEARKLFFKGQYILDTLPTRTKLKDDLYRALRFFNSAILKDPNNAEIYLGSANCNIYLYNFGYLSREQAYAECRVICQQAQSVTPKSSHTFSLRAIITLAFELNVPKTIKLLLKTIEISPADSQAYYWLGLCQIFLSNLEEARLCFIKASEIEPTNIRLNTTLIRIYYFSEDYNKTIAVAKDILEMENRSYTALYFLCLSYARLGIHSEAVKFCDQLLKVIDNDEIRLIKAYLLSLQNQHQEANKMIAGILADEDHLCKRLIYIVLIYVAQKKLDEAFNLLLKYYKKADYDILIIKTEPGLKILRSDKRFHFILRELSLA